MAEDRRQVGTTVNGVSYDFHNGYADMRDDHARAHLRAGNLPNPALSGATARGLGYRCTSTACGRGSFFTTCGRCGSTCVREA
jgi:hypothetical protein